MYFSQNTIPADHAFLSTVQGSADMATGLVHLGNGRYYDPYLGRPLQPADHIGMVAQPASHNRFNLGASRAYDAQLSGDSLLSKFVGATVGNSQGAAIGEILDHAFDLFDQVNILVIALASNRHRNSHRRALNELLKRSLISKNIRNQLLDDPTSTHYALARGSVKIRVGANFSYIDSGYYLKKVGSFGPRIHAPHYTAHFTVGNILPGAGIDFVLGYFGQVSADQDIWAIDPRIGRNRAIHAGISDAAVGFLGFSAAETGFLFFVGFGIVPDPSDLVRFPISLAAVIIVDTFWGDSVSRSLAPLFGDLALPRSVECYRCQ